MKFSLCNEVLQPMPFERQCEIAAAMGYDGLEVAPFTLAADPMTITDEQAREFGRTAQAHGLEITGLHWLLVAPAGLSIVSADEQLRERTTAVMERLTGLCQLMGGKYMVHGSPKQRTAADGQDPMAVRARAVACFERAARRARDLGLIYCVEPLSTRETGFINTVEEAVSLVEEVASPAFKTMIDCSAAGQAESESVPELMARWIPTGHIAHIQVNDPNRRGPGQGDMAFTPILRVLHDMERAGFYRGVVAVEPFDYVPNAMACAARAIGYLRGIAERFQHG